MPRPKLDVSHVDWSQPVHIIADLLGVAASYVPRLRRAAGVNSTRRVDHLEILRVLDETGGQVRETARRVGCHHRTVVRVRDQARRASCPNCGADLS